MTESTWHIGIDMALVKHVERDTDWNNRGVSKDTESILAAGLSPVTSLAGTVSTRLG